MEQTLVIIKPDAVKRGLVGEIITRFEKKGFTITAATFEQLSMQKAMEHYQEHIQQPFCESLLRSMTSGPVFIMVLEADNIVEIVRKMVGETFGRYAEPGTIRGDLCCTEDAANVIHASDSVESAKREIVVFYGEGK